MYTPKDTTEDQICTLIREKLIETVEKHMMSEVSFGLLLSGGLDSSIIASIASRIAKKNGITLNSFCIGLKNSPDSKAAKEVAKHIGTNHLDWVFTVEEGIDFLTDVI